MQFSSQFYLVEDIKGSSTLLTDELTLPDQALIDSLPVGEKLGEGESSEVFSAEGPGRVPLVLKVARAGFEQTLLAEGRALSFLGGECAPRLLGVRGGQTGDALTLVMERAPGLALSTMLSRGEADERLARAVLLQGAAALHRLHAWGLSHGDFKPENVFVARDGGLRIALIDFGLSTMDHEVSGGTPRYLPPQALQGGSVSPRYADAFALSMTVAQILLPDLWNEDASAERLADALPSPYASLLGPLLAGTPHVAPGLAWLLDEAEGHGIFEPKVARQDNLAVIRREYLAIRFDELTGGRRGASEFPAGLPGAWLRSVSLRLDLLSAAQRQGPAAADARVFSDLSPHDQRRLLGRLVGPAATNWNLSIKSDAELVELLDKASADKSLRSLSFGQLSDFTRHQAGVSTSESRPVALALALGKRPVPVDVLRSIADSDSVELRIEAAHCARLAGHHRLGLALCDGVEGPESTLAQAQLWARLGNHSLAQELSRQTADCATRSSTRGSALALLARQWLNVGDEKRAAEVIEEVSGCAAIEEVRALLLLQAGESEGALAAVARGESFVESDEEAARLAGVRGMIHHARSEPGLAQRSFVRACDLSARAGAVLEEATYSTGLAAAATDEGHLADALAAAERAEELFESLDQTAQIARALLTRAAILAALGAATELGSVARRGIRLSQQTGDHLAEAYFHFCLADVGGELGARRVSAQRAAKLLSEASPADRLRAEARLLLVGEQPRGEASKWIQDCPSREALFDWYGAQATALEKISTHAPSEATRQSALDLINQLLGLARGGTPLLAAGPALVAGAHLSLRIGHAEEARSLFAEARTVADVLLAHAPLEHRAGAESLTWVQQARGSRVDDESGRAQLSDVESLLRALSQRRGFRGLLDQVLDLLLLWTGVQRGLILLRAPGGKLVVRAARNLDKNDLSAEQRELSYSMAQRALSEGRPVVAVDAVNDVSAIHRSVHALSLRSVLATPLVARGEVLGVAYLDDRVRRGAFGERELSWVGLISTVAALAIADERDRLGLERALRRAKRAERRLSGELTSREAQLEIAERELSRMKGERKLRGNYSQIIGRSHVMTNLLELVDRVAQSDVPALIVGESGTGKELIARAIASSGPRADKPFVAENCSAVPETLLESTLFGHQKGAFTGATRNQPGLFELAHRGTLFLDEIGDMSLPMQTKLLRVLQEGEVRALGSDRSRKVDVRVIVATHKDLKELVAHGKFREDLYYRLNVVTVKLPPLRDRQEDIPTLVEHFLAKYSPEEPPKISQAALHRLVNFPWPGNVRQLENEVRRMIVLGGEELTAADLSPEVLSESTDTPEAVTLRQKVDALERRLLVEALEHARGNRTRAAEALGLSRFGLQKMAQRLEIQLPKNPPKAGRIRARGLDES